MASGCASLVCGRKQVVNDKTGDGVIASTNFQEAVKRCEERLSQQGSELRQSRELR